MRSATRDTKGIIRMVADAKTAEVIGVTMIGNSAGEVIHEAAMGLSVGQPRAASQRVPPARARPDWCPVGNSVPVVSDRVWALRAGN